MEWDVWTPIPVSLGFTHTHPQPKPSKQLLSNMHTWVGNVYEQDKISSQNHNNPK